MVDSQGIWPNALHWWFLVSSEDFPGVRRVHFQKLRSDFIQLPIETRRNQSQCFREKKNWLVVWLPFFIFPYIGFLIIPIDEVIFFRGVALAHQPAMFQGEEKCPKLLCPVLISLRSIMLVRWEVGNRSVTASHDPVQWTKLLEKSMNIFVITIPDR